MSLFGYPLLDDLLKLNSDVTPLQEFNTNNSINIMVESQDLKAKSAQEKATDASPIHKNIEA